LPKLPSVSKFIIEFVTKVDRPYVEQQKNRLRFACL
jgi:hypothetical protein